MIVACLKLVDRRPEVDPLTGQVHHDARTAGASDADEAALEWALRLGEAWGEPVAAVSAGGEDAEPMLREALACGATTARRSQFPEGAPSEAAASALHRALPARTRVVICGAWSLDRGSASVPAFLAARLGAAQALGLVSLDFDAGETEGLRAERRLDGGRRERLLVPCPAVLSVEGGSARLRRARLGATVASHHAPIDVVAGIGPVAWAAPSSSQPFRPRPRARPAPHGATARERILELTGALGADTAPQRLVLDPHDAADRLLEQLRVWGYLE